MQHLQSEFAKVNRIEFVNRVLLDTVLNYFLQLQQFFSLLQDPFPV